ncbi:MAG: ZIP family metal transporter [Actinomycetes bacterium]|jgi:ZIP family zinc transporter
MSTPILLAAITVVATFLGGLLALKGKDRLHLVLGLSAGLLLGLVAFDLLPEIFEMNTNSFAGVQVVSLSLVIGFLAVHFLEKTFGSHEATESEFSGHKHPINFAGGLGALGMAGHVFLDGVALGIAFQVSTALGITVFIALLAHAFSDGLNTVSLLIKSGKWSRSGFALLSVDAVMRIGGAIVGSALAISEASIGIYLAAFSGIIIYLATSHILPEAHSKHPSKLTMLSTVIGVIAMWLIIGNLGE